MSATVLPFPACRQIGRIRKAAHAMVQKSSERKQGQPFWEATIDRMAFRMEAAGIDGDTIERELSAFRDAVSAEMGRLLQHSAGAAL